MVSTLFALQAAMRLRSGECKQSQQTIRCHSQMVLAELFRRALKKFTFFKKKLLLKMKNSLFFKKFLQSKVKKAGVQYQDFQRFQI